MTAKPIIPGCRFVVLPWHPVKEARGKTGRAVRFQGFGEIISPAAPSYRANDLWVVDDLQPPSMLRNTGREQACRAAWMMRIDPDEDTSREFQREAAPPSPREDESHSPTAGPAVSSGRYSSDWPRASHAPEPVNSRLFFLT